MTIVPIARKMLTGTMPEQGVCQHSCGASCLTELRCVPLEAFPMSNAETSRILLRRCGTRARACGRC